jgi:hypothetical protein
MAERDIFESRLRAALLRHVADGPTDFDALGLARAVAAKEPRRHGFAGAMPWHGVAVPRVVWVLLLLAALLAALLGGTLIPGSHPVRKLPAVVPPALPVDTPPARVSVSLGPVPTCPPGSSPDKPGPVDQARPAWVSSMAFDRLAGKLVILAGVDDAVETWTFDVCMNTWTQMHPNREPPGFAWRPLVYDVDSDLTMQVADGPNEASPGKVWAFDLAADTWTEKAAPSGKTLRAYDPVSGLVLATKDLLDGTGQPERWTYDVETDTWTLIDRATGPAWHAVLAYDASVDRIVAYSPPEMWLFDLRTGTWSRSGAETSDVEPNWAVPTITYDEAAERTVVAGSSGWAAYDAAADRWEVLAGAGGSLAYDPVNRRLIGSGWRGIAAEGDMVAFDLVTRKWTVLLEPGTGQPEPSTN